jgi:hypothetical protein
LKQLAASVNVGLDPQNTFLERLGEAKDRYNVDMTLWSVILQDVEMYSTQEAEEQH